MSDAEADDKKRRYSPEKRREMILDSAAELVAQNGTTDLSLDTIAQRAGVSKTLMYRYFRNLLELLRELLEREYRYLRGKQLAAAESARTYEDLVRGVTRAYLIYIEDRGLIVERLQTYPSMSEYHNPTDFDREPSVAYFSIVTAELYDLPMDIATALTEISFGLPASAGEYLIRSGASRQSVEDLTVAMILGSIAGVRENLLGKNREIKPPSELVNLPHFPKRQERR
ncbi:MAG: helix-turn-helix domain-containing protein [Pseudomonadota bacterium]